jgi:hypothetical protein
MAAVALGFVGLLFFWLIPLGVILAATGLVLGAVGWAGAAIRDRVQPGMAILGTILSLIALIVDVLAATGGIVYLTNTMWGY